MKVNRGSSEREIMITKILFWTFTLLGVVFEISGDVFLKKWTVENKFLMLWLGFAIYAIGALFWAFSLKYEMLSKAISVFTILNLIIVVLIGVLFFKENISTVSKIGVLLGIAVF
jgi:multidrug transporter EmrE-like cation transporter